MNRRIGAALAAIALTASIAAPANADGWPTPLPKPDPNDARIITMGGTITQEQADANAAAYAAVFPYIDQREQSNRAAIDAWQNAYNLAVDAIAQRDIDCANRLNDQLATYQDIIARKDAKIARKDAKIAYLRSVIRDLRN
jgi:hypothetical protein